MHIGINYTSALKQGGGIGRYTRGLVNALARLDSRNRYTLIVSKDSPLNALPALPGNFTLKTLPLSERLLTILWHRLDLPLAIDRWAGPFDLFHSPDFVLPPLHKTPGILTVHDLSFMQHPDGALPKLRQWLNKVVPDSVRRAQHILADSQSTKEDLAALLNVTPNKISIVGAGVESRFKPITDASSLNRVRQRYNLPERFILGLGTLEPRKNYEGLIEAFNLLQANHPELHLVIAGGKGWLYDSIFEAAKKSPAAQRIHLIGFVADEDLPALYSLAQVFAYPSHYEGFGIPVLEAMACGAPVVAANNSSLPEIAGKAAVLLPATDIPALSNAIGQFASYSSLREEYSELGIEQAKKFTWEAAAGKLLTVYRNLVE